MHLIVQNGFFNLTDPIKGELFLYTVAFLSVETFCHDPAEIECQKVFVIITNNLRTFLFTSHLNIFTDIHFLIVLLYFI